MSQPPPPLAAIRPAASTHLFSEIVRNARARAGWSQAEFAARCGRTQSAVSFWEMNRPLKETTLEQVAAGFDKSLEDWLWEELDARRAARRKDERERRKKEKSKPEE